MPNKIPKGTLELLDWLIENPPSSLQEGDTNRYTNATDKIEKILPLLTQYLLSYHTQGSKVKHSVDGKDPLAEEIWNTLNLLQSDVAH